MDQGIDFDELDRYLSGQASPAERVRVDARAAADPAFAALLREARGTNLVWDTDRAWARLQAQMQPRTRTRRYMRAPALALAALFVIALGVLVLWQMRGFTPFRDRASIEYTTATGERRTITLADGSTIELAPASKLTVDDAFGEKQRAVTLDGEGYFQVTADSAQPFVVRSALAETRVLGTAFDVSAYAGSTVQVAVTSGRVHVRATEALDSAVLNAGQAAQVEPNGGLQVRTVDVAELTAWRTGRLIFRDMSLAEVAPVLERWFDIDVVISDAALANARVSAMFQQQPVDDVLQALAETLGARYVREDSRITFYSK